MVITGVFIAVRTLRHFYMPCPTPRRLEGDSMFSGQLGQGQPPTINVKRNIFWLI